MTASSYPVKVNTQLDTKLSRWLWLVKWLLAIPHYVILAFLWLAFFVVSVIAFFAVEAPQHMSAYPHDSHAADSGHVEAAPVQRERSSQ